MVENINDKTIVNLIRTGDGSAYLLLYDNYAPLLYGIIMRIVKEEARAEMLLEKTLVTIWEQRALHDPEKLSFTTWVINLARNFAKHESDTQGTDNELPGSCCMLELVMTKGLNIKQAADRLRISVTEALKKLREELKYSGSIKN